MRGQQHTEHTAPCAFRISSFHPPSQTGICAPLQVGTASLSLQGWLRQGMPLTEAMLEVPVRAASTAMPCANSGSSAGVQTAAAGAVAGSPDAAAPLLGTLVLRLINIGREPSRAAHRQVDFDAAGASSSGKSTTTVRLRAAPFEPGSPVAKELAGQPSPFATTWTRSDSSPRAGWPGASPASCSGGGSPSWAGGSTGGGRGAGASDGGSSGGVLLTTDILGLEHRKVRIWGHQCHQCQRLPAASCHTAHCVPLPPFVHR